MRKLATTIFLATALSTGAGLAHAADLGESLPPAYAPQTSDQFHEFGSGWYLRGDMAFARNSMPTISSDLNSSADPIASNSWSAGIGFGYKFNSWLRADLDYTYHKIAKAGGTGSVPCVTSFTPLGVGVAQTCSVAGTSKIGRWDAMANGYVDLGTWSGLTPYVGAGIGFANIKGNSGVSYFVQPLNTAYVPVANPVTGVTATNPNATKYANSYNLAWALMAGVSVNVSRQVILDFGYRYLNLGKAPSLPSISGATQSKSVVDQEARVGLRYMID